MSVAKVLHEPGSAPVKVWTPDIEAQAEQQLRLLSTLPFIHKHVAGRRMSRTEAHKRFTVADLAEQTAGVECRKDASVVDEIPGAYKSIDKVMDEQSDLVDIVAQLRQIVCVKG